MIKKVSNEIKDFWWWKKSFFNSWYLITRPARWVRMYRAWRSQRLPNSTGSTVVLIRNENDHFLHPVESAELAQNRSWISRSLPGLHDDLWIYPKPYVDLIKESMPA